MFTGNGVKLIGDDGLVQFAEWGAVVNGDGATPLPVGLYLVLAVAAVSGFPANTLGTAIAVGDFLKVEAGDSIVPEIGDNVVTMTTTDWCDISSSTFPFKRDMIDVTTLCDDIKKKRAGKADMEGTLEGVFTVGITDSEDGFLRQFIKIIKQDGSVSFDTYAQENRIMLGVFYINKDAGLADKMAIIAPIVISGVSVGAKMGAAQSFSSSFSFANLNYDDGVYSVAINPAFCRWGVSSDT